MFRFAPRGIAIVIAAWVGIWVAAVSPIAADEARIADNHGTAITSNGTRIAREDETPIARITRPEQTRSTGRIEGVVRLTASGDAPIVSGAYPSRRVTKPAARASEIGNVIVFVKDAARAATLPASRAEMIQQDEAFVPRVLAITRGSTVEFPNADPFFHNVFSLSRAATFDLGRYPRGDRRARTFTRAGLVKVYCHLHSHMSASIMVFDHPYFTSPATDGHFVLNDVPTGDLRLSAWHERIGESSKDITVEAGRTTRVEFSLPVEDRQ